MNEKNPYVVDFREEMSAINRKMRLLFEAQSEVILGLPFEKVGSKILILGAKGGAFANQVKTNLPECEVHGADNIPDLITIAKASYPEIKWHISPLNDLDCEDGYFDVVFISHVFTYLTEEQEIYEVLKEVYRVTKEKGHFILLEADNNSYRGNELLQDLVSSYGMARGGTFYATRILERNLDDFGFVLKSSDKVVFNNKTYSETPEVDRNLVSMDRMSALGLLVYMGYRSETSKLYRSFEKEYLSGKIHFELDYRVLVTEKVGLTKDQYNKAFVSVEKVSTVSEEDVVTVHSFADIQEVRVAEETKEEVSLGSFTQIESSNMDETERSVESTETDFTSSIQTDSTDLLGSKKDEELEIASAYSVDSVESTETDLTSSIQTDSTDLLGSKKDEELEIASAYSSDSVESTETDLASFIKKKDSKKSVAEVEWLGEVQKVAQKKKQARRVQRVEDLTQDLEQVDNAAIKEVGRMLFSSVRGLKLKIILVTALLISSIEFMVTGIQYYFAGDTVNPKRDFILIPFIMFMGLGVGWASYINLVFKQRTKQSTIEMLSLFTLMLTLLMAVVPIMASNTFYIFFLNAWLIMVPVTFAGVANGRTILGFVYLGLWSMIFYQSSVKFGLGYVYVTETGVSIPLFSCLVILAGNTAIPFAILFFESGVMLTLTQKIPLVMNHLMDIAKGQKNLELENSRMTHELVAATSIQEAGIPNTAELSRLNLCKVAAKMIPATEVGGDYYDVMEVDGATIVGVGDVTDHGLKSGMVMLMAQSVLRSLLEVEKKGLRESLRVVNTLLYKNVQQRMEDQRNMTLLVSRIEPGKLTVCGQHESVLIYRVATGKVEEVNTEKLGFPVGLVENIDDTLKEVSIPLGAGDTILFYTDGFVEAENEKGEFLGLPLFSDIFKKHCSKGVDAVLDGIFEDFTKFVGGATVYDDATAVVCRLG